MCSRLLVLLLCGATWVCAQEEIRLDTDNGRQFAALFDERWASKEPKTIQCDVRRSYPFPEYDQTYAVTYRFTVDGALVDAKASYAGVVALRITPLDPAGKPSYFARVEHLAPAPPDIPRERAVHDMRSGSLSFGPGRYRVDWRLELLDGRACRDSWSFRTGPKFTGAVRLQPGQSGPRQIGPWKAPANDTPGRAERRATILVNASPSGSIRSRSHINRAEALALLGALRTMLETKRFDQARVVVFSLYHSEVLYESNNFTMETVAKLGETLLAENFGVVDANKVRHAPRAEDLVARLLLQEREVTPQSGEVYVLGFLRGWATHLKLDAIGKEKLPYGVTYFPLASMNSVSEDVIAQVVRKMGGRVSPVRQPGDLGRYLTKP